MANPGCTVAEHRDRVLALVTAVPPRRVPLDEAAGLVLAEPLVALIPVPPFTNSAMDGYAVRHADIAGARPTAPISLPVTGDIPAGRPPHALTTGTAQRIMTGARIPEGCDCVVPVELTDQPAGSAPLPAQVQINQEVTPGANIRRQGENVQAGEEVLQVGCTLNAASLAAAASIGHTQVLVHPRPRVAVISTGSELAGTGAGGHRIASDAGMLNGMEMTHSAALTHSAAMCPDTAMIPDSNSIMIATLVAEHGGEYCRRARAIDDPQQLHECLVAAANEADVIITTGGVSAGAFDVVKQLPDDLAFGTVNQQPGKPQGWGRIAATDGRMVPILAFPGNPIGAFVSFHLYARPVLAVLAGDSPAAVEHRRSSARAAASWSSPRGREQYTPVTQVGAGDDGLPQVVPAHHLHSGSHLVASLHAADGLAVTPVDADSTEVGDLVEIIPIRRSIR